MKYLLVMLFILVLPLVGCSGSLAPAVGGAPYIITWSGPNAFRGEVTVKTMSWVLV